MAPQFCINAYNITKTRLCKFRDDVNLAECSGALGDLGTFLPLVVGLVKAVDLDLGTTLLFTGVYNIITGFMFDIPMPVQPMKTIAAVVISETEALTLPQVLAAGIFVSAGVLVLGITGLMGLATRLIPGTVIGGMQLGLGLNLALKGWQQVWYVNGKSAATKSMWGINGLFLGIFAVVFILLTAYRRSKITEKNAEDLLGSAASKEPPSQTFPQNTTDIEIAAGPSNPAVQVQGQPPLLETNKLLKPFYVLGYAAADACDSPLHEPPPRIGAPGGLIPSALIIVILGIVLTLIYSPSLVSTLKLGPSTPVITIPSSEDWKIAILRAGLPQLSLTLFNSIVSVTQLANTMFPDKHTSPGHVATSVGLMNLVGCWFGAVPACHGAGGLAVQVRFGARTGAAPVLLGLFKVFLSLLLGSSLFSLLQAFPTGLLGAMLVFAGAELAAVARGQRGERGTAVMMFTAAVVLAMNNVAIGVVAGLVAAYLLALRDFVVDASLKAWGRLRRRDHS